jgi:hypothetical protein
MLLNNDRITTLIWSAQKQAVFIEYQKNGYQAVPNISEELYLDVLDIVEVLPQFDAATYLYELSSRINNTTFIDDIMTARNLLSSHPKPIANPVAISMRSASI